MRGFVFILLSVSILQGTASLADPPVKKTKAPTIQKPNPVPEVKNLEADTLEVAAASGEDVFKNCNCNQHASSAVNQSPSLARQIQDNVNLHAVELGDSGRIQIGGHHVAAGWQTANKMTMLSVQKVSHGAGVNVEHSLGAKDAKVKNFGPDLERFRTEGTDTSPIR